MNSIPLHVLIIASGNACPVQFELIGVSRGAAINKMGVKIPPSTFIIIINLVTGCSLQHVRLRSELDLALVRCRCKKTE